MIIKLKYLFFFILILNLSWAQNRISVSGIVRNKQSLEVIPYARIIISNLKESEQPIGGISNEEGRFVFTEILPGNYKIAITYIGMAPYQDTLFLGELSPFLDLGYLELTEETLQIKDIEIIGTQDAISGKMDKKTYDISSNLTQSGGTVLQALQNLPGITVQEGKVQIRGSDQVIVMIDGKQTALTGFGNQLSLDNLPASSIEKIEIINNPSAKYDANGNAGIINILYKKNKQEGFNGKIGSALGLGALGIKKNNLPDIAPQYQRTPKINPSLSLNYKNSKINIFFQGDYLYTQTLNKNEFVDRYYLSGEIIKQQTRRNRNTTFGTAKTGIDWFISEHNQLTISGLISEERIIDYGEEAFFSGDLEKRFRLWKFIEDESKYTATAFSEFRHTFQEPGHTLTTGFNYTFHREDEKYTFDNVLPAFTGKDAFKLLSDEHVADFNLDYVKPLKYGRIESGIKFRYRNIPTNMRFIPGYNSPLDTLAGGWAVYTEIVPALYSSYIYEKPKYEIEAGIRVEYVKVGYQINPTHNTYKSNGYHYTQPFPNLRVAYKINDYHKISFFYNRRVDRPNEIDIRIFPKYDDAEIIKVGNPALKPQFTDRFELGYKKSWELGYLYIAGFHKISQGIINRIATTVPGNTLIYSIMENAPSAYNTGIEALFTQQINKKWNGNINGTLYQNTINAFTAHLKYPVSQDFRVEKQTLISWNIKANGIYHLNPKTDIQLTGIYLASDLIPQGKTGYRFSVDIGIKKNIQHNKGELYFNATDILNTLQVRKYIKGSTFNYSSIDYYETQVFRIGYAYKF